MRVVIELEDGTVVKGVCFVPSKLLLAGTDFCNTICRTKRGTYHHFTCQPNTDVTFI